MQIKEKQKVAKKFNKLTIKHMRALEPEKYIIENGIVYWKLKNGDGNFSISLMVDGERIRRTIGKESDGVTRQHVEEVIEKLKTEAREKRLNLPKGRKIPLKFEEAASKYIEKLKIEGGKNIEAKAQQLRVYLKPFFKNQIFINITGFDVERYKKYWIENGIQQATVNRQLAVLSHMFNKLNEWGIIHKIPCKVKKFREKQGRIVYLTHDEIHTLLEEAAKDYNPFVYAFIMIGLETAMRRKEILSIALKDIDLERKIIYIPKAKAGARPQPITNNLAKFLKEYIKQVDPEQPWLFPSPQAKSGHLENIEKAFRRVVKAAGMDPYVVVRHTLRHTAITHLVQAGVDLPTVKRISGHKTLQMVERYSHQNGEHIRQAMDKLEQRYNAKSNVIKMAQEA